MGSIEKVRCQEACFATKDGLKLGDSKEEREKKKISSESQTEKQTSESYLLIGPNQKL